MTTLNIFYRIPAQKGTKVASFLESEYTSDQFLKHIVQNEGLDPDKFIIACGTKIFRPTNCHSQPINLKNNCQIDILIPVLGGKGGFGSLLRAIGAQIEKTTNRDACRDLSGRRLRDIKREEDLKKLIALRDKLKEEKKRRRREKLEKLKRRRDATNEETSIQQLVSMFNDDDYTQRRLQLSDILEAAVEKGIIKSRKRVHEEGDTEESEHTKRPRSADSSRDTCENQDGEKHSRKLGNSLEPDLAEKSKAMEASGNYVEKSNTRSKRSDIWLGLDGDDDET